MSDDALTLKTYSAAFQIMAKALRQIANNHGPAGQAAALALDEVRCLVARARLDAMAPTIRAAGELKADPALRGHLRIVK